MSWLKLEDSCQNEASRQACMKINNPISFSINLYHGVDSKARSLNLFNGKAESQRREKRRKKKVSFLTGLA